ncbi:MAG: transcriptional repressor LexA [Kiritimatiellia bacterium]|jgi:repressor LexA
MEKLTEKQQEILQFLVRHQTDTGYPPTVREVASAFGFRSPKAASDHLAALERKGYIDRIDGMARGLRVLENPFAEPDREEGIPIVGDVAAGLPILAAENVLGTLNFDVSFGGGDLFAVRVRGDSMIDYGIYEGDHVIVRKSPVCEQNAIAVVYLEGEATVKKLVRTCDGYTLVPGNPAYCPVHITRETPGFAIAGPVVGVVRTKV